MGTIIKEERYIVYIGTEEHMLRVQELLRGLEPWPERFRAQIPASAERQATTVYGSTGREVVELATEFLNRFSVAHTRLSHATAC
jgi:hypothetical protein